jgi:hypothetical protein
MADQLTTETSPTAIDEASITEAFLDIPDESNPSIIDARKTYVITLVSVVLFVGAVLLFIL